MSEIDERNENNLESRNQCKYYTFGTCYCQDCDAENGLCPFAVDSTATLRCGCYERRMVAKSIETAEQRIKLIKYPTEWDWMECKERALETVGKKAKNKPDAEWKAKILEARHTPIRWLRFSFELTVPYWVSVHLARHIHAQPYILSQRNDRQNKYDRNTAPQGMMIQMLWDMNAEELINIAQKRLCNLAAKETREVVQEMCNQVCAFCPEFEKVLVPPCEFNPGICHEMFPCGKLKAEQEKRSNAADVLLSNIRKLVMTHPEGELLNKITADNSDFQQALEIVYNVLKGDSDGN